MRRSVLPHSIALLQFIVDHLADVQPLFDKRSSDYRALVAVVKKETSMVRDTLFSQSPMLIKFVQLMLLSGVSMFDGLEVPVITRAVIAKDRIQITWKNNLGSTVKLGVADREFQLFLALVGSKIFSKPKKDFQTAATILESLCNLLKKYHSDLDRCISNVNDILRQKNSLITGFEDSRDPDLFFIVLSSLPNDQLNALYLHVQQFIPDTLTMKNSNGVDVHLRSFFQMPSTDIHFLFEKLKIHFNLFFYSEVEAVRNVIQTETMSFLSKSLADPRCWEEVTKHITELRDGQLQMRSDLYTLFIKQLSPLFTKQLSPLSG